MTEGGEGDRPFPDSLCHRCVHLSIVETGRGSVFLRCLEPSLPKYAPQPVRRCPEYAPTGEGEA